MNMNPITSPDLAPFSHGFFTRLGGVSQGLYAGLNGGRGSADAPEAVAENRARIAAHLGAAELVTLHQVHSPQVVVVEEAWEAAPPRADAMVTGRPGLALAVLTADCAPVLLADREAGVIGAAHAGWRGARAGVLEAVVSAMTAHGAAPERIAATVGPTISQRAYEVGPEFLARLVDEDPETARFFAAGPGARALFDLPGYCLWRLRRAGVDGRWTGHCTYGDAARFFSYRRATHAGEPDYGRLVSAIMLPAGAEDRPAPSWGAEEEKKIGEARAAFRSSGV